MDRNSCLNYFQAFPFWEHMTEEDQDFLHTFSFICMLSFDVFVKCMLIEKLIDETKEMEKEAEDEQRAAEKKASEEKKAPGKKSNE